MKESLLRHRGNIPCFQRGRIVNTGVYFFSTSNKKPVRALVKNQVTF